MKSLVRSAVAAVLLAVGQAQVPQLINYQGRVAVQGVNFDGTGQFKFALVDATGTITYWANSPDTAPPDGAPDNSVSLTVTKGLYSVLLGDATLPNMSVMPASVFTNSDVRLRVWFNDGSHGFQLLSPDQRIAAVGYAMMAGNAQTVSDGAITAAKIAAGAVGSTQLASGAVQSGNIATGAVGTGQLATGAVGSAQLAAGALAAPVSITGTVQAASANASYVATSASPTAIQLPGSAAVGAVVQITGAGAGGWSAYSPGAWTPRESNRSWTSITCSSDATKLAATVYNGQIHTSSDAGGTWTAREFNRSWQSVASSADGTKLIAAATGGFLYTSTDSGTTWTQRGLSRGWQAVASSSDGTKLVAVILGGPIYVSSDSGLTWTSRATTRSWQAVCSSADGTKLAAAVFGGQIYLSSDSGLNWTARESSRNWSAIACSADGTKLVATVENGRIYTSPDSGLNWTARESIRSWQAVASSADGTKLAAAENGGKVYLSTDSGGGWSAEESNRAWWGIASSADGSKLAAVEYSGRIYLSSGGVLVASGSQGTTTTLQYLGNGQWAPVGQNQIAAGAVGTANIASGAVGSVQIANGAVQSGNIASGAIQSGNIAGGAVGGPQLATGAVGSTHIAAGAVTSDKVPTGQVVKSINGFRDQVSISAGDHVVLNDSGNGLEIGTSGLWSQSGNPGGMTKFLGTTDSSSLVLKANGTTGLRISPSGETPNLIGGYSGNQVTAGVDNATIAGGGWASNINQVTGHGGAIGGGGKNTAGLSATVGGGYWNQATGDTASILGGMSNVAAGSYASIPGGFQNAAAGDFSLAAGHRAKALHSGSFVWADSAETDFSSTQNDQFLIRAAGGVGINTPNPSGALTIKQTGVGNFLTLQNQAAILANIDASGNINTAGNVNARNTPAIQWSQNYIPGYPDFVGQGAYTLEEITMNLESDGYLMLFAFVNLWVSSQDDNGLPALIARRLKLDDFTNGEPATLVVETLHIVAGVNNDCIHWVLPVSAGNRKIRLVLDASMSEGIQMRIKTHNLSVIFIPKRAN